MKGPEAFERTGTHPAAERPVAQGRTAMRRTMRGLRWIVAAAAMVAWGVALVPGAGAAPPEPRGAASTNLALSDPGN